MPAHPLAHPSDLILQAFGAGQLDAAGADAVAAHLAACPDCRARAAGLSGDSSLHRLRSAPAPGSGTLNARTSGDTAHPAPAPGPSAQTTPGVPPELRDHAQYEVVRELGRGGMGVVYLARNRLLDRPEVLKVVNQQLLDHPEAAERFLREVRAAARLGHRNVVTAYAALTVGDLLVFAMEYVEGEDLAKVVKAHGPLPVANACYYAQQAALGLQHAFEKGMVHRDIKPQNLILAREGKRHVVKVLDFGLAKATREQEGKSHDLTGSGCMLGTPDYMAPEQMRDAARADIRADIYSLGCTLYFLLSGRPPFEANNLYQLMYAHQSVDAAPLQDVRPGVPADLATAVARMLAKDPAGRYQQPAEVAKVLAPFCRPGAQPSPAVPQPAPPPGADAVNRETMLPSQAGVLTVLPADEEDRKKRPSRSSGRRRRPRKDEEDGYAEKRRRPRTAGAKAAVAGPAIALLIAGILGLLFWAVNFAYILVDPSAAENPFGGPNGDTAHDASFLVGQIAGATAVVLWPLLVIGGALQMKRLRGYGLAMTAAVVAMLPCNLCCVLGLPFGIWALVVLFRDDVKQAFS